MVSRCRRLSVFSRHFSIITASSGILEHPTTSLTQQRLITTTKKLNKGDKFNLASQSRRKKKFRPEKLQEDTAMDKIQAFQLDTLDVDFDPLHPAKYTRRDALAATLQQAMSSLLESNDADSELINYNIEITHVKIANDMGHAVFYWKTPEEDSHKEEILANLLQNNEKSIRFLLPSYHQVNICPRVVFTLDKHAKYLDAIENLLNTSIQDDK